MSELITISPIDGRELLRRPHTTRADAERIAQAARQAQQAWA